MMPVWTFRDEQGRHHLAVPIARTEVARKTYSLAVSDRPGLVVLEEKGEAVAPVRDPKVVQRVEEALRGATADSSEPALVFEAKGAAGRRGRYAATRAVAHAGEAFLVAQDLATLEPQVFRLGGGKPVPVVDEDLARRVREIAAPGERAPSREVVLTLPSGERRELDVVREMRVGNANYAIGVDRLDAGRVVALRIGWGGALHPVTDASEIERVRLALRAAAF